MTQVLRQSTAGQAVLLGPYVDETDGFTEETGLTIANTDIRLSAAGGNMVAKNSGGGTHDEIGYYAATFDATDTATVGTLQVASKVAGARPVSHTFQVLTGNAYDYLYGAAAAPSASISGSGGISTTMSSFTATTAGTETNSETDTVEENGVFHIVPPTGGALDVYYEFDIGGSGLPQSVTWQGYVQTNNDNCEVYFYNWAGAAFQQVGSIGGTSGTTESTQNFVATTAHVGTGADLGKVRFRFASGGGDVITNLATDRIIITYTQTNQSIGYVGGAVWINTALSNTNTESFVDGTADNPVSTIAAATTIADNLNLRRFHHLPGSTSTLAQTYSGYEFEGEEYNIALGGQDITNCHIMGASISGTATGTGTIFERVIIDSAVTLAPCVIRGSFFGDITITAGSAGNFYFNDCRSRVAGTNSPNFDFGAAVGASGFNLRAYSGGIEIENMAAGDTASVEGNGAITINVSCTAGTLAIRGNFTLTDNASAAVTLSDGARFDWTRQLTESYAANGVAPSIEQCVMMIHQFLMETAKSGVTLTTDDLGGTPAATHTLDDADTPTSITRAT